MLEIISVYAGIYFSGNQCGQQQYNPYTKCVFLFFIVNGDQYFMSGDHFIMLGRH